MIRMYHHYNDHYNVPTQLVINLINRKFISHKWNAQTIEDAQRADGPSSLFVETLALALAWYHGATDGTLTQVDVDAENLVAVWKRGWTNDPATQTIIQAIQADLIKRGSVVTLRQIPRESNTTADALSKGQTKPQVHETRN